MARSRIPKRIPREKTYVVVTSTDTKVNGIVGRAFSDHGGKVPLDVLMERLVNGVNYVPLTQYADSPNLQTLIERLGYRKYELIEGIVYERPQIR